MTEQSELIFLTLETSNKAEATQPRAGEALAAIVHREETEVDSIPTTREIEDSDPTRTEGEGTIETTETIATTETTETIGTTGAETIEMIERGNNPESVKSSSYYPAVFQNL